MFYEQGVDPFKGAQKPSFTTSISQPPLDSLFGFGSRKKSKLSIGEVFNSRQGGAEEDISTSSMLHKKPAAPGLCGLHNLGTPFNTHIFILYIF